MTQEVMARIAGAAFAVDRDLRVVAWNRGAEAGLGVAAESAIGRLCHEVITAIDVDSGRPCHERCPLVQQTARFGWAHNRILEADWTGAPRSHLDCFMVRCLMAKAGPLSVCFLERPSSASVESHAHVLEAVASVYPVVTNGSDPDRALEAFTVAALRTTRADSAELCLHDGPETPGWTVVKHADVGDGPDATHRELMRREILAELERSGGGAVLGQTRDGIREGTGHAWHLWAPLLVEGKLAGALGVTSKRGDFDLVRAFRGLYVLAVHLGVYLRWALARDQALARSTGDAPSAEQVDLRFECFGPFRLAGRGGPVSPDVFGRLKALALLKFLVSQRGRPVSREALIEVLWPESDPVRAAGNLRVVLHALRRGLTAAASRDGLQLLVSAGDMVYLDPSPRIWVDTEEFVALARLAVALEREGKVEEALDAMRRAARLYKGDYLEDEPYSDWCLLERERLKETYLNLLRQTARIEEQRGELLRAVETYRAALRVDPLREDVHRKLIRLLIELGHVGDALHQYDVCRRELRSGLGADPSPETRAAYAAALATIGRR